MRFILGAFLVLPAWAKLCDFTFPNKTEQYISLKSQEDADIVLKDCTTIAGGALFISPQYEGSLVVNGVTNMTTRLYVTRCPGLTEVVWSDLEVLTNLYVEDMTALRSVSFPKLATIEGIDTSNVHRLDLDFPVLTYASHIKLEDTITRFNAPLLFNVSFIRVWRSREPGGYNESKAIDAFNFSLPSLEYIGTGIELSHINVSDIVLPKLKVIHPAPYNDRVGWPTSLIDTNPVLNISLPSLTYARKLSISYDQSLSLPLLEQVEELTLEAANTSMVLLPALWNGTKIIIDGPITDVSLPALNETTYIHISGGLVNTSCTSAISAWERTNTAAREMANGPCIKSFETNYCPGFSCTWSDPYVPATEKPNVPNSSVIGGVVAGVVVILAILSITILWRRRGEKIKRAKEAAEAREIEMDGLTINGDTGSIARMVVEGAAAGRKDSKDTVVVVGVEERDISGQRSG